MSFTDSNTHNKDKGQKYLLHLCLNGPSDPVSLLFGHGRRGHGSGHRGRGHGRSSLGGPPFRSEQNPIETDRTCDSKTDKGGTNTWRVELGLTCREPKQSNFSSWNTWRQKKKKENFLSKERQELRTQTPGTVLTKDHHLTSLSKHCESWHKNSSLLNQGLHNLLENMTPKIVKWTQMVRSWPVWYLSGVRGKDGPGLGVPQRGVSEEPQRDWTVTGNESRRRTLYTCYFSGRGGRNGGRFVSLTENKKLEFFIGLSLFWPTDYSFRKRECVSFRTYMLLWRTLIFVTSFPPLVWLRPEGGPCPRVSAQQNLLDYDTRTTTTNWYFPFRVGILHNMKC